MPGSWKQWLAPVGRFARWWGSELAGLVPGALRERLAPRSPLVVLDVRSDEILIARQEGEGWADLARVPRLRGDRGTSDGAQHPSAAVLAKTLQKMNPDSVRFAIRLPTAELLTRDLDLPAPALDNLREVLRFQMPQLTPFEAADVWYDYRVLGQPPKQPGLTVRLWAVRRAVLDGLLATLAPLGLQIGGVLDEERDVRGKGTLIQLATCRPQRRLRTAAHHLVWSVNAVLLAAIIAVPMTRERARLADLEARVATARAQAQAASRVREQAEQMHAAREFLIEKRRGVAPISHVLAELTDLLPDATWVQRLEVRGREIHIHGISTGASALIGLIDDSRLFRHVTFRSPVMRNAATGKESFQLAFEVIPAPGDDANTDDEHTEKDTGTIAARDRSGQRL